MDFVYDPDAAYNFTSTALLATLLLVGFTSLLSFYMLRVYPNKIKHDDRRLAMEEARIENEKEIRLAQVAADERNRQREIEQIEGRLAGLTAKIGQFQDTIHRRLDEIEDNRIDEMADFIRQATQRQQMARGEKQ